VWLDSDLHAGQAPEGWIQARSAVEAIQLLDEFVVHELSLTAGAEAEAVIDWLIEQESADRDPWPTATRGRPSGSCSTARTPTSGSSSSRRRSSPAPR
jgi:hypothetical protein